MLRGVDLQQIPLIAALEEADAVLGVGDEFELRRLQLEVVHVEPLVHISGVEEKLVGGDGEEGTGHLPDAGCVEILQVLGRHDQRGLLFPHPLQCVADILHSGGVGEPDVELVQASHGVALCQQLVAEVGEKIKEHGVPHPEAAVEEILHAEHQEAVGGDAGVPVEELALRSLAHGVESQQDLLEQLLGVQRVLLLFIVLVGVLHNFIEVREDGKVLGPHGLEVRVVVQPPGFVQPLQHQLNGINVPVREVLVGAEEVLEEGDVLAEAGALAEGGGGVRIALAFGIPQLGLQRIDKILSAHDVGEAAAHVLTEVIQLVLRVQADHGFAGG